MKKKSTNPRMAMMMGRAMRRPALAASPAVAQPAINPMAAMASPTMPTMKKGGKTMKSDMKEDTKMDMAQDKAMIKKAMKQHDMQEHKGGKGTKLSLKSGGKCYASGGKASQLAKANGIAVRGKTRGKII
jgi:uncharacterized protein involved in copper resistance